MPAENYKKLTIAVIAVLIVGIVIFAVTTSNHKEETSPSPATQRNTVPAGPLKEFDAQAPLEKMENLPDNPEELALLGDKYFETGNYGKAAQAYEKAIQLNPRDADAYNDMGLALHYMRRSAAAVDILRKGTVVDPSYQRVWLTLGFVLMSTGQKEEAKTILRKVAEMDPRSDMGIEARKMLGSLK